jgi:hypothetical protein
MIERNVAYPVSKETARNVTRGSNFLTVKVKQLANLSLSKPRRHRGKAEEYLNSFSIPALDGGYEVDFTPRPLYLRKRTSVLGGFVSPKPGLDRFEEKKNLLSLSRFESRPVQPVAQSLYR